MDLRTTVAAGALTLLALPAPAPAQSDVLSPAYEAVVGRYASGDRDGAIADMRAWPEERLRDETTALAALRQKARACLDCVAAIKWQRIPVAAALMLHTDCALRARRDGLSPKLHESAAVGRVRPRAPGGAPAPGPRRVEAR